MGKEQNGTALLGPSRGMELRAAAVGVPQAWRSLGPTPENTKLGPGSWLWRKENGQVMSLRLTHPLPSP